MFYFDSAGSFPLLLEVKESLLSELAFFDANPSSDHECGLKAAQKIELVREELADTIGAYSSEIIFTSGATESNNLALKSVLKYDGGKNHIITSKSEHKCILNICAHLEELGCEVTYLSPNRDGVIDPSAVESAVKKHTALVSIMHVNNELGTINPIKDIGEICFEHNILFHTDAAQSYGKLEIDVDEMNIDFLSLSAHKIGGIKGVGAIYVRDARKIDITPVIHGAGQELGIRGGTLPTPLIISLGKAAKVFPSYYDPKYFNALKVKLIDELTNRGISFSVNGKDTIPHIISISFPGIAITDFIQQSREKFCIAQGSACSSKEIEASHVLKCLGFTRTDAEKTLRLSFDFNTTPESIITLIDELERFS